MAESLQGFTLGVLLFTIPFLLWKARGWALEQRRKQLELSAELIELRTKYDAHERMLNSIFRTLVELRSQPRGSSDSSDLAIAAVAQRVGQLEKMLAAQDLTILDTAEKVAHKLQDRRRKRDLEEVGDVDDAPNDPNLMLARARAAFGVTAPAPDPAQLQLLDTERSA